jgi:MSHA pilin protein MshA
MKSRQTGVSRTELIVVVAILMAVAGAAMPKKLSLSSVASAAESAMTVNYAGCATTQQQLADKTCVRVRSCQEAALLMHGGLPTGHTLTGNAARTHGENLHCRVSNADGASASFVGLSAGL